MHMCGLQNEHKLKRLQQGSEGFRTGREEVCIAKIMNWTDGGPGWSCCRSFWSRDWREKLQSPAVEGQPGLTAGNSESAANRWWAGGLINSKGPSQSEAPGRVVRRCSACQSMTHTQVSDGKLL